MVEIKSRLESRHFTLEQSPKSKERLAQCLASDPMHITPSSPQGEHIKAIQDALRKIGNAQKELGLPAITDRAGDYGDTTADAVLKYKSKTGRPINRPGQPIARISPE